MFSRTKGESSSAPATTVPAKKNIPSVISGDLHILGSLVSEGVIDVDGNIEGNVKAEQVTVRSNGKIKGDVIAQTVHIYGEVHGLVRAQAVHLHSSCHIEGIVMHQSLTVEDGAFIDGKFKRLKDKSAWDVQPSELNDDEDNLGITLEPNSLRLIG
jgi:cytoskeletal protein CcmA (bactofilin family)